jgi:hypothetical protein
MAAAVARYSVVDPPSFPDPNLVDMASGTANLRRYLGVTQILDIIGENNRTSDVDKHVLPVHNESDRGRKPVLRDELAVVA